MSKKTTRIIIVILVILILVAGGIMAYMITKDKINQTQTVSENAEDEDEILTAGVSDKKIKIFSDFYLPVSITECNNFETIQKTEKHTEEEAKNIAQKKAEDKLNEQITNSEDIKNKTVNVVTTNEYVEVEVIYEVLENIGTEEKIVF